MSAKNTNLQRKKKKYDRDIKQKDVTVCVRFHILSLIDLEQQREDVYVMCVRFETGERLAIVLNGFETD